MDVIQYKCPAKDTGDEKRNRFHMEDIGGTYNTESTTVADTSSWNQGKTTEVSTQR